jgi:hypothetical protein
MTPLQPDFYYSLHIPSGTKTMHSWANHMVAEPCETLLQKYELLNKWNQAGVFFGPDDSPTYFYWM